MQTEAINFMLQVHPLACKPNQHLDFIINVHQTPVCFALQQGCTLEKHGTHTVGMRKSTDDTRCCAFSVIVAASRQLLVPVVAFKGSPKGRIVKDEPPHFPNNMICAMQAKTWMDKTVMSMWVEQVLHPHTEQAPPRVVPLLFLDSFCCHMMGSVTQATQMTGVQVKIAPGGCTGLCQTVDGGIDKPLKGKIHAFWEQHMTEKGITDPIAKPPL